MSDMRIYAKDYGIIPNTRGDFAVRIFHMLAYAKEYKANEVVFEKGEYHFYPEMSASGVYYISNNFGNIEKNIAFFIKDMENFTINGNGSDFIFHSVINPFIIDNSKNIAIKNLTIDWEHPFHGQAKVVGTGGGKITLSVMNNLPYFTKEHQLYIRAEGYCAKVSNVIEVDGEKGTLAYHSEDNAFGTAFHNLRVTDNLDGTLGIEGEIKRKPELGSIIVFKSDNPRLCPAIFAQHSEGVTVEGAAVYHAAGMGFIAQVCRDITLKNFNVMKNPNKNLVFSATADAAHFSSCYGHIHLDGCMLYHQLDDCVNVHGNYGKIERILSDRKMIVKTVHFEQAGVPFGRNHDQIDFVDNHTLITIASNEIKTIKRINKVFFEIETTTPIDRHIKAGHAVENMTLTPALTVENCKMGSNRPRGLLLKTPKEIIIRNNVFQTAGAAVMCRYDAQFWYESGSVHNLLIENNLFDNCYSNRWGNAVLDFNPWITDMEAVANDPEAGKTKFCHSNITIRNNTFKIISNKVLNGYLIDGLVFQGNRIEIGDKFPANMGNGEYFNIKFSRNIKIEESKSRISPRVYG